MIERNRQMKYVALEISRVMEQAVLRGVPEDVILEAVSVLQTCSTERVTEKFGRDMAEQVIFRGSTYGSVLHRKVSKLA